jgi:hypothetical protein
MTTNNNQQAAEQTLASQPTEQPDLAMVKLDDVTHVTIMGDPKLLMLAFGTEDPDFLYGLIHQISNAGAKGRSPDEPGIKCMLAFIKAREPRDEIEAALLAQMAATHVAAVRFAHRLAHAETVQAQDSAERIFNRLMRTFAAQVDALQRYRSNGLQKIVVQHATVSDGRPAATRNGSLPAAERGLKKRPRRAAAADRHPYPQEINGRRHGARIGK